MKIPYLISPTNITLILDGKPYNVEKSHPNFTLIKEALKEKRWDDIVNLVDVPKAVNHYSRGKVSISGDKVFYGNEELHGVIVQRILAFMEEGLDFEPLVKFIERLMANPSRRATEELYAFLEHRNLPIDDEGYFYAYKAVRSDWKDKYSGTIDNSIGKVVEMPRNRVDDDARVGCSQGLHAGSLHYATVEFGCPKERGGTDRILIVKIDPADVVSVPFDCNCQKLRTWCYEVVAEFDGPLPDTLYNHTPSRYDDDERLTADDVLSHENEEDEDDYDLYDDEQDEY